MSNVPAVQDQTPAVAEPRQEWATALEHARSLVNMPEREWHRMWQVSQVLAGSSLVPKVLQNNPQGVMAVGLHCRALDVPFTALSVKTHFHVWEDARGVVIQPAAQLMLGLLHRGGHDAWWGECSDKSATLMFVRRGTTRETPFTYTIEMAQKADLLKKDNWKHHPDAMLRAGACRLAGRYGAPGSLMGLEVFDPDQYAELPTSVPGPEYEWEQPAEQLGERPELSPADFDRPVARLQRQIQALPKAARDELVAEWQRRGLPPVVHPDFVARLSEAEDLVDAATAKAFALPPEADTDPSKGNGDGRGVVGTDAAPPVSTTVSPGRPDAVPGDGPVGARTRQVGGADNASAEAPPATEPARPLAQQIAMQADKAGVDRHHVILAVTDGAKSSAKAVDAEEGELVLLAIADLAAGKLALVERDGAWRLDRPQYAPGEEPFD